VGIKQQELRASAPPWGEPREYVTDDRDHQREDRGKLVIFPGGNGDWYIATMPESDRYSRFAVRLCTSGGASGAVPGLTEAIRDAYRAMGGELEPPEFPLVELIGHEPEWQRKARAAGWTPPEGER